MNQRPTSNVQRSTSKGESAPAAVEGKVELSQEDGAREVRGNVGDGQRSGTGFRREASDDKKRAAVYDLEERLLGYAVRIVRLVDSLPKSRGGDHLGGQLLRSGTSPALNHGEAQAAESRNDFVHKMRICLKELRESRRTLRIVEAVPLATDLAGVRSLIGETEQLIRIFFAAIRTAMIGRSEVTSRTSRVKDEPLATGMTFTASDDTPVMTDGDPSTEALPWTSDVERWTLDVEKNSPEGSRQ